jgi:hypothetical protein
MAMLEQLGIDRKILSIGLLTAASFFLWRFIDQQPENADYLDEFWLYQMTILFGLGLGSLVGLFSNRYVFMLGLLGGSSTGYGIGYRVLPIIQKKHIPLILPILLTCIPLFGVVVVLSLYLATGLTVVLGNLVIGMTMGALFGYISDVVARFSKLGGLVSIICFSLLFVTYPL